MKINVVVEVPENWEQRLDMQPHIEDEIAADRWEWNYPDQLKGSFGKALVNLKTGHKVARSGWNGKGMFLFLVPGSQFKVSRPPLLGIYPEGTDIDYCPHIDMKTTDEKIVPWVASQTDVLADDWEIVK